MKKYEELNEFLIYFTDSEAYEELLQNYDGIIDEVLIFILERIND
tara:strand:+ start:34714 stop:34848 length:135 start_codon:yes stop_codon:yes gene_type:complete